MTGLSLLGLWIAAFSICIYIPRALNPKTRDELLALIIQIIHSVKHANRIWHIVAALLTIALIFVLVFLICYLVFGETNFNLFLFYGYLCTAGDLIRIAENFISPIDINPFFLLPIVGLLPILLFGTYLFTGRRLAFVSAISTSAIVYFGPLANLLLFNACSRL